MSESKGTPGPWHVYPTEFEEADAKLISAAPDLLAACEEAERFLAAFNCDAPDGHEDGIYLLRVGIRAAIAKAKGNQ